MPALRRERLDIEGATRLDGLAGDPFDILMRAEHATDDQVLAAVAATINRARPAWHSDAACIGSDVDFTSKAATERSKAFTLCSTCPVRRKCLQWALELDDRHSILGGTDPTARRAMTRNTTTASTEPHSGPGGGSGA